MEKRGGEGEQIGNSLDRKGGKILAVLSCYASINQVNSGRMAIITAI